MANLKYFADKATCEAFIPQITDYPFVGYAGAERMCLMGTNAGDLTWYDSYPHIQNTSNMTAQEVVELINHSLNDFLSLKSDDGVINTYQEVLEFAQSHDDEYKELASNVEQLSTEVSSLESTSLDDINTLF
jgi:hypothetical protein